MAEGTAHEVLARTAAWHLHHGDCLEMLRALPDNSVDSIVTDPPAGVSFMSRAWDKDKGGRDKWIAWLAGIFTETIRVLKPGGHAFVWALPRTSGWTQLALEDAGFEIRDSFHHLFSTGFPKSLSAPKAIEAHLRHGSSRPEDIRRIGMGDDYEPSGRGRVNYDHGSGSVMNGAATVTAESPEAQAWSGYGTAVKPAHEVWWLARKPLEGTLAQNLLKWGVGALNIDASRVAHSGAADLAAHANGVAAIKARGGTMGESWKNSSDLSGASDVSAAGRFPANVVLSHHELCRKTGTTSMPANPTYDTPNRNTEPSSFTGKKVSRVRHAKGRQGEASADKRYADQGSTNFAPLPGDRRNDTESVDVWDCVVGCAVRVLNSQIGETASGATAEGTERANRDGYSGKLPRKTKKATIASAGQVSRYFHQFEYSDLDDLTPFIYAAKAARSEKEAGLEHFRRRTGGEATSREDGTAALDSPRTGAGRKGGVANCHPTVKRVKTLLHFTTMITPPGGIVVDLFAGSGTGGVAAVSAGFRWLGADKEDSDKEPFISIARARLNHVEGKSFIPRESLRSIEEPKQVAMFEVGG